ncbi:MAG: DUF3987 domain-containing protein [Propionivibrio sp.]|nr:DUF3987 domain-containing protein [Propionivibrio sp.]
MRNLATLNQLWDGNRLTVDRKSSESFTVRGARLTVALQVQEPTLREFFKQSGALARGTGFLARFLVAWPESTQGFRPFTEAPANWPNLAAFNRRIAAILDQPVPIDEDGALTPPMLPLTTEAKTAWIEFHDAIEIELASGGELYDVRDVASKSADNAVRLAALFHVFDGGGGAIGAEAFESGGRIAAWHLTESRQFFGELALPVEMADAARLDSWLIEHCRREQTHFVSKRYVRQHGPLRSGDSLDAAVRATLATVATHQAKSFPTVASVATVAVANVPEDQPETAIKSFRWLIHFTDRDSLMATFTPEATHSEVLASYPGAVAAEPVPEANRSPTGSEAAQLRQLVAAIYQEDTDDDRNEALHAALADPDSALVCYGYGG